MRRLFILILCLFPVLSQSAKKTHWEFGVSLGDPMPLSLQTGFWWNNLVFRSALGGWYQEDLTFWAGGTGSVEYALLNRRFYGIDIGPSFHYFYAQAKDDLAITVNKTLGQRVMYNVQWLQWMACAPQLTVRYFGLFTQFALPVWQSGEVEYSVVWRAGFLF